MDYAEGKYDKTLIEDVKTLLRVLVIFIPIPAFWALFDQTVINFTRFLPISFLPYIENIKTTL